MPRFTMMVGVPGSGKSTVARSLAESTGALLLEADAIRLDELGLGHSPADNAKVFSEMESRSIEALKAGMDVVYDATNLLSCNRVPTLERIKEACPGAEASAMVVDVPPSVCMERNAMRDGERRVPDEVLTRMLAQMERPTEEEGFSSVIVVDNSADEPSLRLEMRTEELDVGEEQFELQ